MGILNGLAKVVLSPLRGISEFVDDVSGKNSEVEQAGSIGTLGASSVVKGTFKGLKEGIDEIFD